MDIQAAGSFQKVPRYVDIILVHFNPDLDLILACDTSSYGIGAVLFHKMSDGVERTIAFASRILTDSEQRYAQIEREALACVFGVKKFHSYLYGHHFTLITDHKPLLALFSEHRAVPTQASSIIQRWTLIRASYEYSLAARSTTQHGNADAMSHLPLKVKPQDTPLPPEFYTPVGYHVKGPGYWFTDSNLD